MKKFLNILSASLFWVALTVPASSAELGAGITMQVGGYETDGTETEKTVTGVTSEQTTTSVKDGFYGASVYAELRFGDRLAIGLDYVPMDIDLGNGERNDTNASADVASEADTGLRTATATMKDLTTLYVRAPLPMTNSMYVQLGYLDADIETSESLPTSSYGNVGLNGIQYGIGVASESGRARLALTYSDFDSISITGTGSGATNQNSITADGDATSIRLSFGF
tara:strand:- start:1100 stop:1774 length:675 start_codon:yes stop_codon:yes gene_type:complete